MQHQYNHGSKQTETHFPSRFNKSPSRIFQPDVLDRRLGNYYITQSLSYLYGLHQMSAILDSKNQQKGALFGVSPMLHTPVDQVPETIIEKFCNNGCKPDTPIDMGCSSEATSPIFPMRTDSVPATPSSQGTDNNNSNLCPSNHHYRASKKNNQIGANKLSNELNLYNSKINYFPAEERSEHLCGHVDFRYVSNNLDIDISAKLALAKAFKRPRNR